MRIGRPIFGIAVFLLVAVGCRGGGDDPFTVAAIGGGVGADDNISIGLDCPSPGTLPFETQSNSFEDPDAVADVQDNAESSADPGPNHMLLDTMVNPGDTQVIRGRAMYGVNPVIVHGIVGEFVSIWAPTADGEWVPLGRVETGEEGVFELELTPEQAFAAGQWPVYAVVEGDQTCAKGGVFVYPEGTQIIVSDIDETMSLSDDEVLTEIVDPTYLAKERPSAGEMMRTYVEKGYRVAFVTARPFHLRMMTRRWLDRLDYPFTYIETASTFVVGSDAREYKRTALRDFQALGIEISRAYGNADSDFQAYSDANIPEDSAFSIGELAGFSGTTAIDGEGYEDHILTLSSYPDAVQPTVESEPSLEE